MKKIQKNLNKNLKVKVFKRINDDHIDIIPVIDKKKKVKKIIYKKNLNKYFENAEGLKKFHY